VISAIEDAVSQRSSFELEYRIQTAAGEQKWVWERGRGQSSDDGTAVWLEGFITDVSRRRTAEERVARQAKWLNEANDAILVLSLDYRIIYWNKGATRLYGWTAEAAMDQSGDLLTDPQSNHLQDAFARVKEQGTWEGELRQVTQNGRKVDVMTRWTLVRDEEGRPESIFMIGCDMSEQRKLQDQLLRAQRMESIGTLASGIAHDLNNVLSPILMSVQLLRRKTGAIAHEPLDVLETSAKRGADLVRRVLAFARGVEGERAAVQVSEIITETHNIAKQTFPMEIGFELKLDDDLWTVFADAVQLEQVFMNLFVNARDAMPTGGGTITVRGRNVQIDETFAKMNIDAAPGSYVCIEVADTGSGMSRDILERIFEPFFTTKAPGYGTGLGLSTALTIVRSHQGFVHAYSEVGFGSTFRIYLPAAPNAEIAQEVQRLSLTGGNGETVLVVDDQSTVRDMARMVLQEHGYHVITAENGAHAVATYAREAVDVVLLDWSMPVMDGEKTIAVLRSMDPDVRIIASSGLADKARLDGLGGASIPFLPKPYTADALLEGIAALIRCAPRQRRPSS
jgi:PAS domain S-box-containing protein